MFVRESGSHPSSNSRSSCYAGSSRQPQNARHHDDVSWKLGEHVDLVFREYYRQWLNNNSAQILLQLHKSMTARGISGEAYLREEFDWIRSAISPAARQSYLVLDRKGRKFSIAADR